LDFDQLLFAKRVFSSLPLFKGLCSLCRSLEVSSRRCSLGADLVHFLARTCLDTGTFGVDVAIQTGLHFFLDLLALLVAVREPRTALEGLPTATMTVIGMGFFSFLGIIMMNP